MSRMPSFETLSVEVQDDTVVASLDRPQRLNAVSSALLADLVALADWLRDTPDLHFLVLDHNGPVFSAGADLGEVRAMTADPASRDVLRANQRLAQDMMAKMSGLDQISFAALRGSAYGAGVAIAMTADFRVMADEAVLNLPETNLSMFLTYGSTPRLVAAVGATRAKQMILFAEDWTAAQCLEAGVAQQVVAQDEVRPAIDAMIATLRERDWAALRVAKQVVNAATPVRQGDMIMTEPELAAATMVGGTLEHRLDEFLTRKKR